MWEGPESGQRVIRCGLMGLDPGIGTVEAPAPLIRSIRGVSPVLASSPCFCADEGCG